MKIKNTLVATLVTFAFAAAAFAASPQTTSDNVRSTAPAVDNVDVSVLAASGGIYDAEALVCVEAAPETDNMQQEVRCWKCSADSKGSCGGGDKHCYGERSDCSKKGCKITGSTSKCSGSKKTC